MGHQTEVRRRPFAQNVALRKWARWSVISGMAQYLFERRPSMCWWGYTWHRSVSSSHPFFASDHSHARGCAEDTRRHIRSSGNVPDMLTSAGNSLIRRTESKDAGIRWLHKTAREGDRHVADLLSHLLLDPSYIPIHALSKNSIMNGPSRQDSGC